MSMSIGVTGAVGMMLLSFPRLLRVSELLAFATGLAISAFGAAAFGTTGITLGAVFCGALGGAAFAAALEAAAFAAGFKTVLVTADFAAAGLGAFLAGAGFCRTDALPLVAAFADLAFSLAMMSSLTDAGGQICPAGIPVDEYL